MTKTSGAMRASVQPSPPEVLLPGGAACPGLPQAADTQWLSKGTHFLTLMFYVAVLKMSTAKTKMSMDVSLGKTNV